MRSVNSGYQHGNIVMPKRACLPLGMKKAFSLVMVLAFITIGILGISGIGPNTATDPRSIVNGFDLSASSKVSSGLRAIGLASTVYADECTDAEKCDKEATEHFNKFKDSGMADAGLDPNDEFANPNSDKVNDNWMSVFNQADAKSVGSINAKGEDVRNFADIFTMVLKRIMPGYYLNPQLDATADDPILWSKKACTDRGNAPTLKNSNCDIPNISTDALQSVANVIDGHGLQNAGRSTAVTPWGMGYSKELLPTDDVPLDLKNASANKYTALEVLGYDLKWTLYNGEWDYIKVNSQDRLRMNMSAGGWFKTAYQTGKAAVSGAVSAIGDTVNDIGSKFQNGEWVQGVAQTLNPVTWLNTFIKAGEQAVSSALYRLFNNIMNSIELGSSQEGRWYRPTFVNETLYNARAITNTEKNMIISSKIESAVSDAYNQTSQNLPSQQSEADIRQKYSEPPAPTVKEQGESGRPIEMTWDEWKKANKDAIELAKNELGIDASKHDHDPTSTSRKYRAFMEDDWRPAVERKVAESKEQYRNETSNIFFDFYRKVLADKIRNEYAARPSSSWIYCMNADGSPDGTPEDDGAKKAIAQGTIRSLGKEAYGPNGDKEWQCSAPERPTIVGALMGSSAAAPTTDTRRNGYNFGLRILDGIVLRGFSDNVNDIAGKLLYLGQRATMVLNTLIGWSFTPILDKFGIKPVIMNWVQKLRDTIYMQFAVMFIAVAGLLIIYRLVRGHPVEAFKQVAIVILTFGLGICLLFNTELMFKLVDDVPASMERALIGTIFRSTDDSDLCTATGTPKGTVSASASFSSMFGESHTYNPDAQVRVLQCKVWTAFVLSPWSYGQFNAGWNHLWASGHKPDTNAKEMTVDAATKKLVGSADVPLGGGVTLHNWALYQIRHTTSGTISTKDLSNPSRTFDANMYRLVDLQAGPDNGAGRASGYFQYWSSNIWNRLLIGVGSLVLSVLGLIGIGGIAVKKIQYTLSASLMLLLSPIMLLFGLLPGRNQLKMKQYGAEILALCLKRLAAVMVMGIALEVLVEIMMGSSTSWVGVMLAGMATCICVIFFGKEIVDKFTAQVDSKAGQWAHANDVIQNAVKNNQFMSNLTGTTKEAMTMVAGGIIGGAMAGQLTNPNSARKMRKRFMEQIDNGTGDLGKRYAAYKAAKAAGHGGDAEWADMRKAEAARNLLRHNTGKSADRALKAAGLDTVVYGNSSVQEPGGSISGGSVLAQQLKFIEQRAIRTKIHQGRSSPIGNALQSIHEKNKNKFQDVRREALAMMNNTAEGPNAVLNHVNRMISNGVSKGPSEQYDNGLLTDKQLRIMVMSCANPEKLMDDITRATASGDDKDWRTVADDLMTGNVVNPDSAIFRTVWASDPKMVDEARVQERGRLEDKYHTDAVFRAQVTAEASANGVSSDAMLDQYANDAAMSGKAAMNMASNQMELMQEKQRLEDTKRDSLNVVFSFNPRYATEKANRDSEANKRAFREKQEETKRATKPLLEQVQVEQNQVRDIQRQIDEKQRMLKDPSLSDHGRSALESDIDDLSVAMTTHEAAAEQYRDMANAAFDEVRDTYFKADVMEQNWTDEAKKFFTALKTDAGFAAAASKENYMFHGVRVGDYMEAVSRLMAADEAIKSVDVADAIRSVTNQLRDTQKRKSAVVASGGSANEIDQLTAKASLLSTKIEKYAQSVDRNTIVDMDNDGVARLDAAGHVVFSTVSAASPTVSRNSTVQMDKHTVIKTGNKARYEKGKGMGANPLSVPDIVTHAQERNVGAGDAAMPVTGKAHQVGYQNYEQEKAANLAATGRTDDMHAAMSVYEPTGSGVLSMSDAWATSYYGDMVIGVGSVAGINGIVSSLDAFNAAHRPFDKDFEGRESKRVQFKDIDEFKYN